MRRALVAALLLSADGTYYVQGAQTCPGVCLGTQSPITNSGTGKIPVLGCQSASGTAGGCLTDGGQFVGGAKTFTALLTAPVVDAGVVLTPLLYTPSLEATVDSQGITLLGRYSGSNGGADVIIGSAYTRSAGHNVSFQLGGVEVAYIDSSASMKLAGGSFITDLSGGSAGSVITGTLTAPFGAGLVIKGSRSDGDPSAEVIVSTRVTKTTGYLLDVQNHGADRLYNGPAGDLHVVTDTTVPAFVDSTGGSGHLSLTVSDLQYLVLEGQLPGNYAGHHGANFFGNGHGVTAGWIAEFNNGATGTSTDKVLMINYQGGLTQFGGYSVSQFAICGNQDVLPTDGGVIGTDAGFAFEGTLMYANDTHRWYQCLVGLDGGSALGQWQQVKLAGDP